MSKEFSFEVKGTITISAHSHTEAMEELRGLFSNPETEVEGWDILVKNAQDEQAEWIKALKSARKPKKKIVVPNAEEVPGGGN